MPYAEGRAAGLPRALARLVLMGVGALAVAAQAQVACPRGPLPPGEGLAAHARQLARLAPRCAQDAGYLAWYGAVLLDLGQVAAAAEHLERALLLEPHHLGARLDYARALAALGEPQAARELARTVAEHAPPPPAVQAFLAGFLPPAAVGWRSQGQLSLRAGLDDNLNRATRATNLALTLPGGELLLPLEPSARARSGGFVDLGMELTAQRAGAPGHALELQASARTRRTPGHGELGQEQLDALALWRWPQAAGEWTILAGAGTFRWQGETLRNTGRLGLRRGLAGEGCRPWLGLDLEARQHPMQPALDHSAWLAQGAWVCAGGQPWALQLAAGREFDAARPGGAATRVAVRALAQRQLGAGSRLEGEAQLAHRREEGPYSPLLEGGARLSTTTAALRLDWRHPLGQGWEGALGLELERQAANLQLFSLSRRAVSVGVSLRW